MIIEIGGTGHTTVPAGRCTQVLVVRNLHANPAHQIARSASEPFVSAFEPAVSHLAATDAAALLFHHPKWPLARTLGRLVRAVERRVVGVVVGAEAAEIPVDLLAGSSMGAVIAIGLRPAQQPRTSSPSRAARLHFPDLSASSRSRRPATDSLAGSRLLRRLRRYFAPPQSFADLVLPARVMATDLAHARRIAIGDATPSDAVRASIAMPPIVAPVVRDGQTLVNCCAHPRC